MKKIFVSMVALMSTIAAMAQVITFERTEHDFGKINEADGRVTTVFSFKNEGMEPLVLSNVRASCGCTTPKWTREPIEPGQSGEITVTYNPNGRPGRFQKTITVTSNAQENGTAKLYIKGEVIPKPAKPVNQYTVQMGELSLKSSSVNFGDVKMGDKAQREIEYANKTTHELNVDLATRPEIYLGTQVSLNNVQPEQTGKFQFFLDTENGNLYGPVEYNAYVVLDGKKEISDTYKLTITANIVEDFSKLSVAERQNAPIAEISSTIGLGKFAAGKKVKKGIELQNAGPSPLMVRRAYCSDKGIELVAPKSGIKSGKKSEIKFTLNTGNKPGNYTREILVITNDPVNPVKKVTLTWTVEG